MAAEGFDKFKAPSLALGIDISKSDFSPVLVWNKSAYNVTSGIDEGIGPRYAMAPLPGHMDQEALVAGKFPGLMLFESIATSYSGDIYRRQGMFGISPFKFRQPSNGGGNIDLSGTYYSYLISYITNAAAAPAGQFFDVLLGATSPGGTITHASDISAGLQFAGADSLKANTVSGAPALLCEKIVIPEGSNTAIAAYTTAQQAALFQLLRNTQSLNYVSSTPFAVTGADIPMRWVLGQKTAAADATHAPSLGLGFWISGYPGAPTVVCGVPSSFNYGNFSRTSRNLTMYTIFDLDTNDLKYISNQVSITNLIYKPLYFDQGGVHGITTVDSSVITWNESGAGVRANIEAGLLNDEQLTINSSYQGMAIAAGKPLMAIYQDWYRSFTGEMQQYIDLSTMPTPQVVTNSTPTFGAAGTGILRAATQYEFGVSLYDKRLNYETNVTFICVTKTGANDFVNAVIFIGGGGGVGTNATIAVSQVGGAATTPLKFPHLNGVGANPSVPQHLNYLEYRFYYRTLGQAEWFPALFIDAAKYWFYPNFGAAGAGTGTLTMCSGGIGALIGGRPGGFADYSTIPQDAYNCVVMYKNRAFWFSEKAMVFSLTNNLFAYPQRNSASCPVGAFKGALVQAYYGQANQDARLVVFATKGTYVGKFTGNLLETSVQISTDTAANFGLDGSDFVLDAWTSITAFSYRSAVVAEGILYLWGPQGIYMDNGVNPITPIADNLRPDLFSFYDPSLTDQITCTYNDTTKEVIWFYPPKTADGFATHALVYNTLAKTFLPQKYNGKVDAVQSVVSDTAALPTSGTRTMVISRATSAATVQRAYYYDHLNRAGDIFPTKEMMVKTIATPAAGQRRLTLAAGFDAANFATIIAGDRIALTQVSAYATSLATPADFLATVLATNGGAGTIDILLPSGVTFDAAAALTQPAYLPIWHATAAGVGLNGFAFQIPSKYWVGAGGDYWAQFMYLFWQMRVNLLPNAGAAQTLALAYRTPISDAGTVSDTLTLVNNSDGNWQLYHPLQIGDQNAEGQGLKFTVSGIQIASEWVLQYLELHALGMDGDQLKMFEG